MGKNLSRKKPNSANKRSHACNSTKTQQKVNLQVVRLSAREKRTLMKDAA